MNRRTWMCPTVAAAALAVGCNTLPQSQRISLLEGERAFCNKDYQQAVDRLSRFLDENANRPEAARARYVRGMALALVGDRTRAYRDLEQAARSSADPQLTWQPDAVLGVLLFEDEQWDDAARALRRATDQMSAIAPKDALLFRIGLCCERTGRWSAAPVAYRQIVSEFPRGTYRTAAARRLSLNADHFAVQCGAFSDRRNAERLVAELTKQGLDARTRPEQRPDGVYHVVVVGRYATYGEATAALARVKGYVDTAVLWP
jgi:tetratricopeptide (TPR) repeat protein